MYGAFSSLGCLGRIATTQGGKAIREKRDEFLNKKGTTKFRGVLEPGGGCRG